MESQRQTPTISPLKLNLQPPQKHVDKSQKQQFILEFPPEALGKFIFDLDSLRIPHMNLPNFLSKSLQTLI